MKAYIKYITTKDGIEYSKWVPSVHYENICEELLEIMKGGGMKVYRFGSAFVLALVACLESNLNDWLIIDTFEKHGPRNYEAIVNGYISLGPRAKYRVAVSVMTDNAFQVREECAAVGDGKLQLSPSIWLALH